MSGWMGSLDWVGSLDWGACAECKHDSGDGCEYSDRPIELEQDGDGVLCAEFELVEPAEEGDS